MYIALPWLWLINHANETQAVCKGTDVIDQKRNKNNDDSKSLVRLANRAFPLSIHDNMSGHDNI